jgi:hypothetical protein
MAADWKPTLRAVEERFYRLVTAPEGVERGLEHAGLQPSDLEQMIDGDERLDATARLDIYADMYFYRILDVLRDDYPKLLAAVGDTELHNLVTDYLVVCPPRHPSIGHAGARLPALVAEHRLQAERPWLAELALLEWRRVEVFDAADADALTLERLRATPPDQIATLAIKLVPAHAVVHTSYAVDELWRSLDRGEPPSAPSRAPRTILVWRQGVALVHHRALDATELQVLDLLRAGAPFGLVCERLADGRSLEDAAQLAFALLVRLAQDGALAA